MDLKLKKFMEESIDDNNGSDYSEALLSPASTSTGYTSASISIAIASTSTVSTSTTPTFSCSSTKRLKLSKTHNSEILNRIDRGIVVMEQYIEHCKGVDKQILENQKELIELERRKSVVMEKLLILEEKSVADQI